MRFEFSKILMDVAEKSSAMGGAVLNDGEMSVNDEPGADDRFLIFRLGSELYGCRLTQICEVIKIGSIKPVPYMVEHFKGVINLRGKIIGVIDLPQKLGLVSRSEQRLILLLEGRYGSVGVIVDEVLSVEIISKDKIDSQVNVASKIGPEFFEGIGRIRDRLVHLVRISDMISEAEFRSVNQKSAA